MANLTTLRLATSDGSLPAFAWPGGYQMVYTTEDGLTICPVCANSTDTTDPVVGGDIYWEGPDLTCDDGGETIHAAYGDPDAEPIDHAERTGGIIA